MVKSRDGLPIWEGATDLAAPRQPLSFVTFARSVTVTLFPPIPSHSPINCCSSRKRAACYSRPHPLVSSHLKHNYMMNNYWSYRSSLRRLTTQLNYYIRKHLKQPLPSLHANHASRQSRPFGLTRRSTLFASAISIRPLRRVCTRVSAKALRLLELRLSANTSFTFLLHTTSHIHVCRPSETTGACPVCTSATTSTSSASRGSTRLDCAERGWRQ
jgi:hypothetical protein